jgi:GTP-binding protein
LVHVIDLATMEPGRDPLSDLDVIEAELARYGGLEDRPRIVALNKADVPDGRELAEIVHADLEERGMPVLLVSAATHEGLKELGFAMARVVAEQRASRPAPEPARIVLRPRPVSGGDEFTVAAVAEGWQVRGEKPERWVRQTDFSNDEAVGFLADRLNRLGVEVRLVDLGAREGDTVVIGGGPDAVVFDFRPSVEAGAELLGRRGEDHRFEEARPAAQRRRAIDEAFPERGEGEARADVVRRLSSADIDDESPQAQAWDGSVDWEDDDPGVDR